jgi:Kef-type K+ transport system membrane component KefB
VSGGTPEAAAIDRVLREHTGHHHHELLAPLGYFFVPVFFVYTGMQVQLTSFFDAATVAIALGMTVVALVGKIAAGYVAGDVDRALVGWGMVPRGEVGLIFAMVGKQLGVVSEQVFAVIVIMIILTTVVTPVVLVRLLRKHAP